VVTRVDIQNDITSKILGGHVPLSHRDRCPCKFLCLKPRGHWAESRQISTRCTEIIADYSAEIKIGIFQYVWKRQRDEWRSSSNCGRFSAT